MQDITLKCSHHTTPTKGCEICRPSFTMKEQVIKRIRELLPELYDGPKQSISWDHKVEHIETWKSIHLEDVLRAIGQKKVVYLKVIGRTVRMNEEGNSAIVYYDTELPFSDQSDDVYAFLNSLIN